LNVTFSVIYDGNFQNYNAIVLGLILLSIVCLIIMHFNYKPEDYI
jgi:ABC-2 type transport system permease protein